MRCQWRADPDTTAANRHGRRDHVWVIAVERDPANGVTISGYRESEERAFDVRLAPSDARTLAKTLKEMGYDGNDDRL